jgi:hypothetical protein
MSKPIKVDRLCAMGAQVRVQESCVTQFIIVIVGNILGHIAIEILERKFVRRISHVGWAVVGLGGAPKLIVLRPQIALYNLDPCCEPEKVRITFGKASTALRPRFAWVINNALAGSNVAPTMPRPLIKERRPTVTRLPGSIPCDSWEEACVSAETRKERCSSLFIFLDYGFNSVMEALC